MLYRPTKRRSRAADWGRRFGALALPVLILAILGHRFYGLRTDYAFGLVVASGALGTVAIVFSTIGAAVVWDRGHLGGGNAICGLFYGLIAALPALFGAWAVYTYPRLSDVTTDIADPPHYKAAAFARMGRMNSVRPPPPEERAKQRQAFPDIVTRRFQVGSDQLFAAAKKSVDRLGWRITDEVAPKDESDRGVIEAVAHTLVFAFEDDVVIRIYAEPNGARIDVRSSSRWGDHDLGANARRIRAFFVDLDLALNEALGG